MLLIHVLFSNLKFSLYNFIFRNLFSLLFKFLNSSPIVNTIKIILLNLGHYNVILLITLLPNELFVYFKISTKKKIMLIIGLEFLKLRK